MGLKENDLLLYTYKKKYYITNNKVIHKITQSFIIKLILNYISFKVINSAGIGAS